MAKTSPRSKKSRPNAAARLSLRVTARQKEVLTLAAVASDKTLTEFVLDIAYPVAEETLAEKRQFVFTAGQWDAFCHELEEPPEELPALRRLLTGTGSLDDT